MGRVNFPYLDTIPANGRTYYYYRRGKLRIRIKGDPESPGFHQEYLRIHTQACAADERAQEKTRLAPKSLAALIAAYRASPEWTGTAPATKIDYNRALGPLETEFGHLSVPEMPRKFVFWLRDRYATKPGAREGDAPVPTPRRANRMIAVLSIILTWAVNREWRPDNPAFRVPKLKTFGGYRAWSDVELATMLGAGTTTDDIRHAVILAYTTGQRGQDLIRMKWSDYDGEGIYVVQLKTNAPVWIPLHEQGGRLLDTMPRHNAGTILTRADGRPWKINHFRHEMGAQIRAAGLSGIVTHGLRTTAAKWMAEAGCSEREIMAITGHTSPAMVSRYVREASQKRRAQSAATKVTRYRLEQGSAKTGEGGVLKPQVTGSGNGPEKA